MAYQIGHGEQEVAIGGSVTRHLLEMAEQPLEIAIYEESDEQGQEKNEPDR